LKVGVLVAPLRVEGGPHIWRKPAKTGGGRVWDFNERVRAGKKGETNDKTRVIATGRVFSPQKKKGGIDPQKNEKERDAKEKEYQVRRNRGALTVGGKA